MKLTVADMRQAVGRFGSLYPEVELYVSDNDDIPAETPVEATLGTEQAGYGYMSYDTPMISFMSENGRFDVDFSQTAGCRNFLDVLLEVDPK